MLPAGLVAALAPGTVIGGKYRVERLLGSGGMGVVVAAKHLELGQDLAIKVLLPSAAKSPESTARFLREGRAAAQLTSPHVARVYDTGRLPSGAPYLVMELLRGRDLRAVLADLRRVPLAQAIDWVLQAAHALAEAHGRHIIHRDIKPANLFLAESSAGQHIKVLDFGVSKQLDSTEGDLTNTTSAVGTPRYMAPEQMRSARLADARGDVWSLGVVLYELTTGESPFRGDSVPALCFDVMERTPARPSERNSALPAAFDEVIARCLEKEPNDRFQSVDAFAAALRALAPGTRSSLVSDVSLPPASAGTTPVSAIVPSSASPQAYPPTETFPGPLFPTSPPQETMPGWNTTPLPRPALKKPSRSPFLVLGVGTAMVGAAVAGVFVNHRLSANVDRGDGAAGVSSTGVALRSAQPAAPAAAEPAAAEPTAVEPTAVEPTAPEPAAAEPAAAEPTAVEPTAVEPTAVDSAPPPVVQSSAPAAKSTPPLAACRPPFYIDKQGYQRVKPWCR